MYSTPTKSKCSRTNYTPSTDKSLLTPARRVGLPKLVSKSCEITPTNYEHIDFASKSTTKEAVGFKWTPIRRLGLSRRSVQNISLESVEVPMNIDTCNKPIINNQENLTINNETTKEVVEKVKNESEKTELKQRADDVEKKGKKKNTNSKISDKKLKSTAKLKSIDIENNVDGCLITNSKTEILQTLDNVPILNNAEKRNTRSNVSDKKSKSGKKLKNKNIESIEDGYLVTNLNMEIQQPLIVIPRLNNTNQIIENHNETLLTKTNNESSKKIINNNEIKSNKSNTKTSLKRKLSLKKSLEIDEDDNDGFKLCHLEDMIEQNYALKKNGQEKTTKEKTKNFINCKELQNKILAKEQELKKKKTYLESLLRAQNYKAIHKVDDINNLTELWKVGCISSLKDFLNILHNQQFLFSMAELCTKLKIPSELLQYNENLDEFV